MLKSRHVRLMVALGAAVGLHALLFALLQQPQAPALRTSSPIMLLDLRQQPAVQSQQQQSPTAKPTTPQHIIALQKKRPQAVKKQKIAAIAKPTVPQPSAKQETTPPLPSTPPISTATQHIAKSIPPKVRHQMLSHVQYPKQARRHAWQGRAELQISILQQNVDDVVLLQSTGHPILDRAAQIGLASIADIPLANGIYFIPVEFRLQ